jgi:hypothetical protein
MNLHSIVLAAALAAVGSGAGAATLTVCPQAGPGCAFVGGDGVQQAVDAARDGDEVLLKPGRYVPAHTRDVPFGDLRIRGFVVVAGKRLTISGEDGVALDGASGVPATALVADRAEVSLRNLTLRGFRYGEPEDDVYDGHGIFAIDSRVRLDQVRMERIAKMGLTGRGDTLIEARDLSMSDGHMGVWLEETAHADLHDLVIRRGDSAAVGVYGEASAKLYNAVIQAAGDDGLYATGHGAIFATRSIVAGNRPFGLNAEEQGRIVVTNSVLYGNAGEAKAAEPWGVRLGADVLRTDPQLGDDARPRPGSPLAGRADLGLSTPSR